MTDNPALFLLMVGAVAFLIGLSKGGLGGMLGSLATPLMALVMPADQVIGLLLPILIAADFFAVASHWRGWQRRLVLLLLPGAVVGVTIGTLFITNVATETLRQGLGVIVLIFALYKLLEKRILRSLSYAARDWHGLVAGTIAGFASALAHSGGPPVSIYLLLQDIAPSVFIATSVLFFAILNLIKVPYYLYAGLFDWPRLLQVAWLLPLVPLGVWLGKRASLRIDKRTFERLIVWLLLITALLLIFT